MLEIKNLSKNFEGVVAVGGVNLVFPKASISGIIGPNGSGKTTLTNLLSGSLAYDEGDILIESKAIGHNQAYIFANRGVTRTFQEVRLFDQMTVLDNLLLVLTERQVFKSIFDTHSKEEEYQAEQILKKVNLLNKKNELAGSLSYGQRKLLEVARVVAADAKIVLFDEPFAGMFPEMIKIVVEIIKDLKNQGKTVILVEHNMELIKELCSRVYVMDSGKVLAEGTPTEVLENRQVIEAYLGE